MRKNGGTSSRRDKHVTPAAISPPGVAWGRFFGGQQSGLAGCKPPPLFTRGACSCSSQGRRQGEPWGASPRPRAPTYLPQTMTAGSGRQQPSHVETRGHHSTIRRMGPDRAPGEGSPAPDAATRNQGNGVQGSGTTPALQGHRQQRPGIQRHSTSHATHRRQEGRCAAAITASSCTHRKHNRPATITVCITTSSSITSPHNPATSHTN